MFRRAKGRRAGFHIDIRSEGAIADGRAGACQLCQGDGGKRLGMAQGHRRLDGDRGHRAHQREGRHNRHLAVAGEINQPLCHRDVDLARRVGVDDGVAVAFGFEFGIAQPAKIAQHFEAFHHLRRAAAENERQLVGLGQLRFHGEIVPDIHRHILRLCQRRHHLKHIEMLRQLDQLAEICGRPRAASAFKIGGMRRAGTRLEDKGARLQQHVAVAAGGAAQDGSRRAVQRGFDHLAADPDHFRSFVAPRPAFAEDTARLGEQDLHPQRFQHGQRRLMHAGDGVVGIELHHREGVAQIPVIHDARGGACLAGLASTAAAAPVWSLIVHDIRPRYVSGLIRDAIKAAAGVNRI